MVLVSISSCCRFNSEVFCPFLKKFPKDGVKKLLVQMEKQKLVYEEKALVALQKATQEKTEALSKAETLQVKYLAKYLLTQIINNHNVFN